MITKFVRGVDILKLTVWLEKVSLSREIVWSHGRS